MLIIVLVSLLSVVFTVLFVVLFDPVSAVAWLSRGLKGLYGD